MVVCVCTCVGVWVCGCVGVYVVCVNVYVVCMCAYARVCVCVVCVCKPPSPMMDKVLRHSLGLGLQLNPRAGSARAHNSQETCDLWI